LTVGLGDGLDDPLGLGAGVLVGLGVGLNVGVVVLVLVGDGVGDTVGVGLGPTWLEDTTMPTMMPATARTATMTTMIHAEREDFLRPLERGEYDTVILQVRRARGKFFRSNLPILNHGCRNDYLKVVCKPEASPFSPPSTPVIAQPHALALTLHG
jgi:hypothetical protein